MASLKFGTLFIFSPGTLMFGISRRTFQLCCAALHFAKQCLACRHCWFFLWNEQKCGNRFCINRQLPRGFYYIFATLNSTFTTCMVDQNIHLVASVYIVSKLHIISSSGSLMGQIFLIILVFISPVFSNTCCPDRSRTMPNLECLEFPELFFDLEWKSHSSIMYKKLCLSFHSFHRARQMSGQARENTYACSLKHVEGSPTMYDMMQWYRVWLPYCKYYFIIKGLQSIAVTVTHSGVLFFACAHGHGTNLITASAQPLNDGCFQNIPPSCAGCLVIAARHRNWPFPCGSKQKQVQCLETSNVQPRGWYQLQLKQDVLSVSQWQRRMLSWAVSLGLWGGGLK